MKKWIDSDTDDYYVKNRNAIEDFISAAIKSAEVAAVNKILDRVEKDISASSAEIYVIESIRSEFLGREGGEKS